ncbi:PASTA domain-containing protein [Microbacterium murale]|uniref:PASTA domain-containing protein n=1 Tax=Microbacterium murale TaxID=1081040 RepID=UPI00166C1F06|nr:PASTA domain-containing protein [Microbacterium murale]
MPDVIGMNAAQAIDAVELMGLEVDLDGGRRPVIIKKNWTVTASDPAPESLVEFGSTVVLTVEKIDEDADKEQTLRETDEGLTKAMAVVICTRAGEQQFPYGFDMKSFGAHLEVRHDEIYIDSEVEVTNEANAARATNMECTVSGTDDKPTLEDFLVY